MAQANARLAWIERWAEGAAINFRAIRRDQNDRRMRRPGLGNTFVPYNGEF